MHPINLMHPINPMHPRLHLELQQIGAEGVHVRTVLACRVLGVHGVYGVYGVRVTEMVGV